MESDAERGFGSAENDGEELSPVLTTMSLNRGMDSIVAKAGTLSTLENIKGIISFERKFKRAIDTTPFDVYEGTVGWSETDMRFVEKGWRRVQEQMASTRTSSSVLLALSGNPNELFQLPSQGEEIGRFKGAGADGQGAPGLQRASTCSYRPSR